MLASSTTFASAILAQVTLRSVSTIGCVLAAVWALSPLGGQASLRIMTVGQRTITNLANFDYLSAENSYVDWRSSSAAGSYEVTATGLYLASLTGPQRVKDSPRTYGTMSKFLCWRTYLVGQKVQAPWMHGTRFLPTTFLTHRLSESRCRASFLTITLQSSLWKQAIGD
jgi:hypothetical protein